jgi:hypothetical protein
MEYRTAFADWALQVGRLQRIDFPIGHRVRREAEGRTAAAEANYRITRDRMYVNMARES